MQSTIYLDCKDVYSNARMTMTMTTTMTMTMISLQRQEIHSTSVRRHLIHSSPAGKLHQIVVNPKCLWNVGLPRRFPNGSLFLAGGGQDQSSPIGPAQAGDYSAFSNPGPQYGQPYQGAGFLG